MKPYTTISNQPGRKHLVQAAVCTGAWFIVVLFDVPLRAFAQKHFGPFAVLFDPLPLPTIVEQMLGFAQGATYAGTVLSFLIPVLLAAPAIELLMHGEQSLSGAFSDHPITRASDDSLNRTPTAKAVAQLFRNKKTSSPLVVALTGPWGSGKTSTMNLVAAELQHQMAIINFNPWHYGDDSKSIAALMESIRDQALPPLFSARNVAFRVRLLWFRGLNRVVPLLLVAALAAAVLAITGKDVLSVLRDAHAAATQRMSANPSGPFELLMSFAAVVWASLAATVVAIVLFARDTASIFSPSLRKDIARHAKAVIQAPAVQPHWYAEAGVRYRFSREFGTLCCALGRGWSKDWRTIQPGLLLVIDDLDRCEPKQVEGVMATINFLASSTAPMFVVLGMDWDRVTSALTVSFEKVADAHVNFQRANGNAYAPISPTPRAFSEDYLEKIIQLRIAVSMDQVPVHMPPVLRLPEGALGGWNLLGMPLAVAHLCGGAAAYLQTALKLLSSRCTAVIRSFTEAVAASHSAFKARAGLFLKRFAQGPSQWIPAKFMRRPAESWARVGARAGDEFLESRLMKSIALSTLFCVVAYHDWVVLVLGEVGLIPLLLVFIVATCIVIAALTVGRLRARFWRAIESERPYSHYGIFLTLLLLITGHWLPSGTLWVLGALSLTLLCVPLVVSGVSLRYFVEAAYILAGLAFLVLLPLTSSFGGAIAILFLLCLWHLACGPAVGSATAMIGRKLNPLWWLLGTVLAHAASFALQTLRRYGGVLALLVFILVPTMLLVPDQPVNPPLQQSPSPPAKAPMELLDTVRSLVIATVLLTIVGALLSFGLKENRFFRFIESMEEFVRSRTPEFEQALTGWERSLGELRLSPRRQKRLVNRARYLSIRWHVQYAAANDRWLSWRLAMATVVRRLLNDEECVVQITPAPIPASLMADLGLLEICYLSGRDEPLELSNDLSAWISKRASARSALARWNRDLLGDRGPQAREEARQQFFLWQKLRSTVS